MVIALSSCFDISMVNGSDEFTRVKQPTGGNEGNRVKVWHQVVRVIEKRLGEVVVVVRLVVRLVVGVGVGVVVLMLHSSNSSNSSSN